ncbi:MAG: hypothetical protein N2690_00150 [Rhodocyclaceae bacterium]|nr:hypothetical protein [Rhodocyclaceae bacterium]
MDNSANWSTQHIDDKDVVDQHAAVQQETFVEIDQDNTPPSARQAVHGLAEQQQQRGRRARQMVALGFGLLMVVMTAAWFVRLKPQEPVALPKDWLAGAAAAPAAQDATAGAEAKAAQPAAPTVAANPAETPRSPVPQAAVAPPQSEAAGRQGAAAAVQQDEGSARLAELQRLQEENEQLKAKLAQAQQQAAAAPRRAAAELYYGADVQRIYQDGVVFWDAQGQAVTVAIGEVSRRYGRILSTDPQTKTFRTDRGLVRPMR